MKLGVTGSKTLFSRRLQEYAFRSLVLLTVVIALVCVVVSSCEKDEGAPAALSVRDQLGRSVAVPERIDKIVALHHVGGKVVFALGQQEKLVDQALYREEGAAMARLDPSFARKPTLISGYTINTEQVIALAPDVAFAYASFKEDEVRQLENAGIKVIGLKAESFEESYEAVRLAGRVLGCEQVAEAYIADCEELLGMVKKRVASIAPEKRVKVMFAGPRGVYTVATGEMLTSEIISRAGGCNVAAGLKGFWADVSPEQVAAWNPDVIFVGSTLNTYGVTEVLAHPQFRTVKAVRERRIHAFPSNIGWWDFPAPHCVLGVVWTAKTLYPDRFADLDVTKVADRFYTKYMGHSFTAMGGRL
jgi:iron complex transport system substrate-binding protein